MLGNEWNRSTRSSPQAEGWPSAPRHPSSLAVGLRSRGGGGDPQQAAALRLKAIFPKQGAAQSHQASQQLTPRRLITRPTWSPAQLSPPSQSANRTLAQTSPGHVLDSKPNVWSAEH